jgi:hypothetical protein
VNSFLPPALIPEVKSAKASQSKPGVSVVNSFVGLKYAKEVYAHNISNWCKTYVFLKK